MVGWGKVVQLTSQEGMGDGEREKTASQQKPEIKQTTKRERDKQRMSENNMKTD